MSSVTSIVQILWRHKNHEKLSQEELLVLRKWLEESPAHEDLFDDLSNQVKWEKEIAHVTDLNAEATWQRIQSRVESLSGQERARPVRWIRYISAAASVTIIGVLIIFLAGHNKRSQNNKSRYEQKTGDLWGKSGNATLILDNGTRISIDTLTPGSVVLEGGAVITKKDSASLSYPAAHSDVHIEKYNTLLVGKGRQFHLQLPDGSLVWLNAESSLRYPVEFSGITRSVELHGEGYFEVTKNREKPFIVRSGESQIRVLGTRFNIKAYPHEVLRTVLGEGSVLFSHGSDTIHLRPGMEARVSTSGSVTVDSADIQMVFAWRNHLLWFNHTSLVEMMNEISRAYDVDVVYEGKINYSFTGILPRNIPLSDLLVTIEKGGNVHFSLEGKIVRVSPDTNL